MRHRKTDVFFFICGLFMLSGEIWKQLTLTFILGGGQYNWWYFPFQLCSIPMYILLLYPWIRRTALKQALLAFLMCYGLLGGIAVFADTTGLHYPLPALTAFSYGWHILLIVLGTAAGTVYLRLLNGHQKKAPLRPFLYATCRLSPSSERPSKKGAAAPFSVCHLSLSCLLPGRRTLKHSL